MVITALKTKLVPKSNRYNCSDFSDLLFAYGSYKWNKTKKKSFPKI